MKINTGTEKLELTKAEHDSLTKAIPTLRALAKHCDNDDHQETAKDCVTALLELATAYPAPAPRKPAEGK